jgi:mono/diheme cytochrome c family protein
MLLLITLLVSEPASAADVGAGRELAQRWCASCHAVSSDQPQMNVDVPSFPAIAVKAGLNAQALAFFLLEPHPKMPSMSLTRTEASDIAAYIATLRR